MKIKDCKVGMVVRSTKNIIYRGTYTITKVNSRKVHVLINNGDEDTYIVSPYCLEEVK